MRVLAINSFFSKGGPPRIVKGIYDTVIKNGDECLLASSRSKPEKGMNALRIGNSLTTYSYALCARVFDNDGFGAKEATKDLIKKIKEYSPDIIHLHNLHGYYINIEILFDYLKGTRIPIIWTFHDCWPITGHCPHFTRVKCDKYKTGCYNCPQKKEYPASYVLDQSKSNWKRKRKAFLGVPNLTIVCVSQWLEARVKESFLSGYKTRVIYNGVDLSVFKHVESKFRVLYKVEEKKLLLGVSMHWMERKGLFDFIKLAKLLGDDYRIILVGLSPNEVQNLPNNIIPIPPVSSDRNLAEIYSACDLYLNLSYEETFGLTSIEALACGTPIITYDLTAVPEISRLFDSPIVPAGDICELKKMIERYFKKGNVIQNYDVSDFDQCKQYQEYYKLFKELL